MGEVDSVLKAFSCESCSKYVCNAMHVHSKCSDCCEVNFDTDEIDIPKSLNNELLDVDISNSEI